MSKDALRANEETLKPHADEEDAENRPKRLSSALSNAG
jgi:hypothetical protein